MTITDELLYQYAGEARDLWLAAATPVREAVPEFVPSPRFRRKMAGLLRKMRRPAWTASALGFARRIAAVILVVLTVTVAGLVSSEAFRAAFLRILTQVFPDMTYFTFSSESGAEAKPGDFTFTYLPQGFEEVEREVDAISCYVVYQDTIGTMIRLYQSTVDVNTAEVYGLDTEDAQIEYFTLNDVQAMAVTKGQDRTILWTRGSQWYSLFGTVPMDELKLVAQGLREGPS